MSIKFIYFDVGQVLVDIGTGWDLFCKKFQLKNTELFDRVWAEHSDLMCLKDYGTSKFYLDLEQRAHFSVPKNFDIIQETADMFEVVPHIQELLLELSNKYEVGLLTNMYPGLLRILFDQGKLPKISYTTIIDSSQVNLIKPSREIFELAQQKSSLLPAEIFYIDDKEENIDAASHLGWNTYLLKNTKDPFFAKELKNLLL